MAPLPQELVVEIQLRLPVKSLLRFKCVSKSLCALIESPDFIRSHLTRFSQNFNLRKLIFSDEFRFYVYDFTVDFEKEILLLQKPVLSPWKRRCGYCNGLFLVHRQGHKKFGFSLSLWNPSTSQFGDIPDCPFQVTDDVQLYRTVGLGLGYDDSIDDYKAFFVVHVERKIEPKLQDQVWIYTLKSNTWRKSLQDFPYLDYKMDDGCCSIRFPGIGHYAEGSMHWLCHKVWPNSVIVALDVKKETFSIVPQPVCPIKGVSGVFTDFHVLEGRFCVSYFLQNQPLDFYFYMRNEDGVTWTKLFCVTETEPVLPRSYGRFWFGNMRVLGYSKSADKILLNLNRDGTFWYDLKNKSFRKFEIDEQKRDMNAPFLCLESLASLGGRA